MGYSSYWKLSRDISERNFKKLTNDMKAIEAYIKKNEVVSQNAGDYNAGDYGLPLTLHNPNGEGDGVLYLENQFCFNGDGSKGLDHESMHICLGENTWCFTKTARKPYDLAVSLILISLKYHIRSTRVTSDGNNDDWRHSLELWNKIFPKRNVLARFKKWVSNSKEFDGSLILVPKSLEYKLEKFSNELVAD